MPRAEMNATLNGDQEP